MTTSAAGTRALGRLWVWVLLLGLIGQLARAAESLRLDALGDEARGGAVVSAALVAFFAIAATLAALSIGAWSSRVARRETSATSATSAPGAGGSSLSSVLHGLRPTTIRRSPDLYLALLAWALLGTSLQVFLPFLIGYLRHYLGIDSVVVLLVVVLLGASVIGMVGGRALDRRGPLRVLPTLLGVYVVGLVVMFTARDTVAVAAIGAVLMGAFLLCGAALSATVRNQSPPDRDGQVRGLRTIAVFLLPSLVGPFLGALVIDRSGATHPDGLGLTGQLAVPGIFLAAAVVALLVLVPWAWLRERGVSDPVTEDGEIRPFEHRPGRR